MNNMKGYEIMKNMKKCLSVLLAMVLVLVHVPLLASAESGLDGAGQPEIVGDKHIDSYEPVIYAGELVVGHPTVTKGDFFTEMFGNDTADIDVRALIHGQNLVNWDENQGTYIFDRAVVREWTKRDDLVGDRIYRIRIWDDMKFSDGSPVTAWDYAFSLLLMMSPEIEQIGGKIYRNEHIVGYDEYATGLPLKGVRIENDYTLIIKLNHEFLPYFFEQGLFLCVPYPISVIAPGCKVYDDGEGIYIANEDETVGAPLFTADLLKKTILDEETGYNSHPSVVSGPYVLTESDGVTCHFEINPYFIGKYVNSNLPDGNDKTNAVRVKRTDGTVMSLVRPVIERICFTVANNDTLAQDLADGKLHLVNKVVYGEAIDDALRTADAYKKYPRVGLSFVTFTYDWPTVHEMEVRQAIAWCMDRDELTQYYCRNNGYRVDGYFGIEQWEYRLLKDKPQEQLEDPINLDHPDDLHVKADYKDVDYDVWETLTLDNLIEYKVDTEKANALLDAAGWTLNKAGEKYAPGADAVRCKMVDGELVALELKLMYPAGNHIVDVMPEYFINNLNQCGITLELVPADMQTLLASYYRETERTTDMIYLATNFHVIVDPAITYSTDSTANHLLWNNTYSDDEELYYRAVNMRKTDPYDVYDYVARWVAFQERYNEVLPTIPVYGNYYYDFWCDRLQNYDITAHVTWTQAILNASFSDQPEPTATPEP